jgi:ATP-dependent protease ClpP protease subunit
MPKNRTAPENRNLPFRVQAADESNSVNTFWIYSNIGEEYWNGITAEDVHRELQSLNGEDVVVRIHSRGGSVVEGFIMMASLKDYAGKVDVQIDGWALSMASVASMGVANGGKIRMASNGRYMIHGPRLEAFGTEEDLLESAKFAKNYKNDLAAAYAAQTGKPAAEFVTLMSDRVDHWYTAAEALEMGFIDEIIEMPKAAACAAPKEISAFGEIPEDIAAELAHEESEEESTDEAAEESTDETSESNDDADSNSTDENTPPVEQEDKVDPVAAERARSKSIMAACRAAGKPHLAENYIDKGYALDIVQDLLTEIKAAQEEAPQPQHSTVTPTVTSESTDIWSAAHKQAGFKTK